MSNSNNKNLSSGRTFNKGRDIKSFILLDIVRDQDIKTPTGGMGQKSLGFLPDIPFQRTMGGQAGNPMKKHNASSMNYRMTTTDSSGINPFFLQSLNLGGGTTKHTGGSSNSSSPSSKANIIHSLL